MPQAILPIDCRFYVGAHFICAESPNEARGFPFGLGKVLQAKLKEDIVPLYCDDNRPFTNQTERAVRNRAAQQP